MMVFIDKQKKHKLDIFLLVVHCYNQFVFYMNTFSMIAICSYLGFETLNVFPFIFHNLDFLTLSIINQQKLDEENGVNLWMINDIILFDCGSL